jgi:hypothetical protein
MEVSGLAAFGVFLILAFILPGFCYLLIFYLCFPETLPTIHNYLPKEPEKIASSEGESTRLPGFWMVALGIVGGLLLTSVSFAIEVFLRGLFSGDCTKPEHKDDFFCTHFPVLDFEEIARIEAAGKGTFTLHVMAGEALMHLNIGIGILLMLLMYLFYRPRLQFDQKPDAGSAGCCARILNWSLKNKPQPGLTMVLIVIIVANLYISSTLFRRFPKNIEPEVIKIRIVQ